LQDECGENENQFISAEEKRSNLKLQKEAREREEFSELVSLKASTGVRVRTTATFYSGPK